MAKLLCVFSTLTASVDYVDWKTGENGVAVAADTVSVKGGAGVANDHIVTPRGVATMVTEAQAEMLKRNSLFQLHRKNGFVSLDSVERPPGEDAIEKAVSGMEGRDNSAPLVAQDFTANGMPSPKAGTASGK